MASSWKKMDIGPSQRSASFFGGIAAPVHVITPWTILIQTPPVARRIDEESI